MCENQNIVKLSHQKATLEIAKVWSNIENDKKESENFDTLTTIVFFKCHKKIFIKLAL